MVQATPEIRRALLRQIGAPPGRVTIERHHRPSEGDEIIVRYAPGYRLNRSNMPRSISGIPIRYERRLPVKALG